MPTTDATTEGAGTTGTQTDVPRERVPVWPIPESQARQDAAYIAELVRERDMNDEETETLIALTLMKASGAIGLWEFESRMRDLFLTVNRRKNGYRPLW